MDCEVREVPESWGRRELLSVVSDVVVAAVVVVQSWEDRGEAGPAEAMDARGEVVDVCWAEVVWGERLCDEDESSEIMKLGRVASVETLASVSSVSSLVRLLDSS